MSQAPPVSVDERLAAGNVLANTAGVLRFFLWLAPRLRHPITHPKPDA